MNAALTKAPSKVIDYIIIHELDHLEIRDHSRRYWSLVHKFMPDYRLHKKGLEGITGLKVGGYFENKLFFWLKIRVQKAR